MYHVQKLTSVVLLAKVSDISKHMDMNMNMNMKRNFTAAASGVVKENLVTNALRELSIGFCRGNGALSCRALGLMACASGLAF